MPQTLFFPFYGPGRRADFPVIEIRLQFAPDEEPEPGKTASLLAEQLASLGEPGSAIADAQAGDLHARARYGNLLARAALALQRACGHRVNYTSDCTEIGPDRWMVLVEHEDAKTGMAVVGLLTGILTGQADANALLNFSRVARARALPNETRAIMAELRSRDIPFLQPEREPLDAHYKGRGRLRPGGLLCVGQGKHSVMLDGTFSTSGAGLALRRLLSDPRQRRLVLQQTGLPMLPNPAPVLSPGQHCRVLVINRWHAAVQSGLDGSASWLEHPDPDLVRAARMLSDRINGAPVALDIATADGSRPLGETGGAVIDFDLAPDLGKTFAQCQDGEAWVRSAAARFVDWLFPEPDSARIPIVAITGTNGKTSTSRMAAAVLGRAGMEPGLVCSDGIYERGRRISKGDGSAFIGHARALMSQSVSSAVLEAHHRGIAVRGFAFDHCDVAVCLNVTEDHIAPGQIETLEEMVEIKRALVERGREGAVLNADNAGCRSMRAHVTANRVAWYSSTLDPGALRERVQAGDLLCVIEQREDDEWIVLHDDEPTAVMPVAELPFAHGGAARCFVENAMAVVCAAHLLTVSLEAVRQALGAFELSHDNTPGRLNVYRGLPFTVVVDYAHNPDGMRRLAEFAERFPVGGRRLMLLAGTGSRSDEHIVRTARACVGVFDHYVCRSYPRLRGREPEEVQALQSEALLESGVPGSAITTGLDPVASMDAILKMAGSEDLVVMVVSSTEFEDVHRRLSEMQRRSRGASDAH